MADTIKRRKSNKELLIYDHAEIEILNQMQAGRQDTRPVFPIENDKLPSKVQKIRKNAQDHRRNQENKSSTNKLLKHYQSVVPSRNASISFDTKKSTQSKFISSNVATPMRHDIRLQTNLIKIDKWRRKKPERVLEKTQTLKEGIKRNRDWPLNLTGEQVWERAEKMSEPFLHKIQNSINAYKIQNRWSKARNRWCPKNKAADFRPRRNVTFG